MLQGEVLRDGWRDRAVKESLDLCPSCKGCKSECPTNVDIATYKSEFLSHYYEGRIRPLSHYAFGFVDRWARAGARAPALANALVGLPGLSHLAKAALGIAGERKIPQLAKQSFVSWLQAQGKDRRRLEVDGHLGGAGEVILFADTFNNFFNPGPARAAWEVLSEAGFSVHVPQTKEHLCCGRPLYDFGLLDAAETYLRRILRVLGPAIDAGLPVIVLEPSCASVFRDELRNLLPHDAVGYRLRKQTFTLAEFLQTQAPGYKPPQLTGRKILLHGHCHHKSVLNFSTEEALLKRMGANVQSLDSGCCGMAGPFGFEKEKIAVSRALGERVLLPAVRAAGPEDIVMTDGFSCREQIVQNSARRPLHLAEVLRLGAS
jgi:Fe-S oxidoreductase